MSFATPLALIGLVAVPLLIVVYLAMQRARQRGTTAFATVTMTDSVAPHHPGWRRHAPMLAYLLAIAALIVAIARPRINITVSVQRLQTMLAIDVSGSMAAADVSPNRVTAAQHAANVFVVGVPSQVKIGVMQFNQSAEILALPTTNRRTIFEALGRLRVSGGTAIGNAIHTALSILSPGKSSAGKGTRGVLVLLSDGTSTSGSNQLAAARLASRLHIRIYTIALGTPGGTITVPRTHGSGSVTVHVPPDPASLAQIARASGGLSYAAADANHLSAIYKQISSQISRRKDKREITTYLIVASLVLALLGGAMSLGWFGRLI